MLKGLPSLEKITKADLILSANRALLCEIRPNMRRISVEYLKDERKIICYFYYDTPPSKEDMDYDVEGTILAEMSCDFPQEIIFEQQAYIIPSPNELPKKGIAVYQRYEP